MQVFFCLCDFFFCFFIFLPFLILFHRLVYISLPFPPQSPLLQGKYDALLDQSLVIVEALPPGVASASVALIVWQSAVAPHMAPLFRAAASGGAGADSVSLSLQSSLSSLPDTSYFCRHFHHHCLSRHLHIHCLRRHLHNHCRLHRSRSHRYSAARQSHAH